MSSSKSPIRSRSRCPDCGSALYYVRTVLTFLTGERKRVCLAANCSFQEARRFKFVPRYDPFSSDHTIEDGPRDRT